MAFADGIASDKYDVSSMYINAAGLAFIENTSLLLDHSEDRHIHASNENISLPLRLGKSETIAFGLSVRHVGYIGQSVEDEFKTIEYGYDIAYAKEVAKALSIGGGLNVRFGKSPASDLWAVSGHVGVFYLPSENLSFGLTARQLGNGIIYSSDQVTTTLSSSDLPESIEAGVSMRYPTKFRALMFVISASNEKVLRHDGIIYRAGGEFLFRQWLVGRIGYLFDSGSETGSVRYGVGVRFARISCDYAISPQSWSDELYRVSIAISVK